MFFLNSLYSEKPYLSTPNASPPADLQILVAPNANGATGGAKGLLS